MTDTLVRLGADQGRWREIEGGWELRFERRLRHSPERVWAALTTPGGPEMLAGRGRHRGQGRRPHGSAFHPARY